MAFKVSASVALLLTALLLTFFDSRPCQPDAEDTESIRLERFTVGVTRSALRRYRIKDIRVGAVSVLNLFTKEPLEGHINEPQDDNSWYPAGYLKPQAIRLHINSGERLDKLKRVLISHPDKPLEVLLWDKWNPVWTRVSRWNCKAPYEYSIRIPVEFKQTKCDEVTRLVYDRIISPLIKERGEESQTKRETGRRLEVNDMFDKLTADGEIEAYLDSLGPITDNPCVKTIRLLKMLKEEKADRFGLGEYGLSVEIRGGLKLLIDAMAIDPGWWNSSLSLKVTGYTDEVEVDKDKGKELLTSKTGIGADIWDKVKNPFEVYYGGCSEDRVLGEKVYLSLTSREGERPIRDRIYNNCELGAVRAYVALIYLTSELGRVSPDDTYATGGIYSGPNVNNKSKDNPEKRRVNIEFTLKAVKVDDASPYQ